jgi:hypothetical protein
MKSLERMKSVYCLERLYCGHGPIVDKGIEKINEYIEHRNKREQEIYNALTKLGKGTVSDIVEVVYPEITGNPVLSRAAGNNVALQLNKLLREQKVSFSESEWMISYLESKV